MYVSILMVSYLFVHYTFECDFVYLRRFADWLISEGANV